LFLKAESSNFVFEKRASEIWIIIISNQSRLRREQERSFQGADKDEIEFD
jgi:hypothetical protein